MNTLWIVVIGVLTTYLAYNLYAKWIDRNIIQSDAKRATPARMYMDGVDFMPTSRNVLFGYHFKAIAAAGPIVGPITAANLWGWSPSLAWLVLGRQLHRLGERLLGHHGRGAQRRQQPVGDRAQAHRAAHAHDPVRLHLLLPDAARRRVRRHPGGDPVRASGRAVRHHHARPDGAARRPDDVPLEDGHHGRHGLRRRAHARRHGGRAVGPAPRRRRARWCKARSRPRSCS